MFSDQARGAGGFGGGSWIFFLIFAFLNTNNICYVNQIFGIKKKKKLLFGSDSIK